MEEIKAKLAQLCKTLSLNPAIHASASALLSGSAIEQRAKDSPWLQPVLASCAIYFGSRRAVTDPLNPAAPAEAAALACVDMGRLCSAAAIRPVDFFSVAKALLEHCEPSDIPQWKKALTLDERSWSCCKEAFERYNRLFHWLVDAGEVEEQLWALWEVGWLVVACVACKHDVDLHAVVLCSVNSVLCQLSTTGRQRAVDTITSSVMNSTADDFLMSPATIAGPSSFDAHMLSELDTCEMLADTQQLDFEKVVSVHKIVMPLVEETRAESFSVRQLEEKLDKEYSVKGRFNARFFLQKARKRRSSERTSPSSSPAQRVSVNPMMQPSPLKIVRRSLRPSNTSGGLRWLFRTPAGEASGSRPEIAWLQQLLPLDESEALKGVLSEKELLEPGQLVLSMVQRVQQGVAGQHAAALRLHEKPEEHKKLLQLVQRLFLRTIRLEATELSQSPLLSLLQNENFIKSVLALSFEVVIVVHQLTQFAFPFVLSHFQVEAFELSKMIDTFVRLLEPEVCDPSLPSSLLLLRRHFLQIDLSICEYLSWASNSPVHQLLAQAHAELQPAGLLHQITSDDLVREDNYSSLQLFCPKSEPLGLGSQPKQTVGPSSVLPTPAAAVIVPTADSRALDFFLRKVLHSAARLVHELCTRLHRAKRVDEQQAAVSEAMWMVMEQHTWKLVTAVLGGRHSSDLLNGRHLDTVILCALYGMFRVHQRDLLSFNEVVDVYKSAKGVSHESRVYRKVLLQAATENTARQEGDICEFYNSAFVPVMLKCSDSSQAVSPAICPQVSLHPVAGGTQLRSPVLAPAQQPRSVALYCVGQSPGAALEKMNQVLCENRRRKASLLDLASRSPKFGSPSKQPRV